MTVERLVEELDRKGVQLEARGDRLRIGAPAGVLTPELTSEIAAHKQELLASIAREAHGVERIQEGPYAGFYQSRGIPRPNPALANEALLEAERWRHQRADWLRSMFGLDRKETE